jgi:hypothetical protein
VAAGAGSAAPGPAAIAGAGSAAGYSEHGDPEYPPVPGMQGDRKANEFWHQFNVATYYQQSPEMIAAFKTIAEHVKAHGAKGLTAVWQEMVRSGGYPGHYASFARPIAGSLRVMSRVQLEVFDRFYRRRSPEFVRAFALFGQGVLYDPRAKPPEPPVHTNDRLVAYHEWHAYLRAMMLVGVDRERWREFAPVNAFTWAVQATALPDTEHVNPPLPPGTVRRLAMSWLPRRIERLDRDFQSSPAPTGS